MFDNIGEKIKGLATFLFGIECIACIITGFVMMVVSTDGYYGIDWGYFGIGVAIAIGGSLIAWASSFFMYGFGELICRVCSIEEKLSGKKQAPSKPATPTATQKPQAKASAKISVQDTYSVKKGTCELCNAKDVDLYYCKINDELGIRLRNICEDCLAAKDAECMK